VFHRKKINEVPDLLALHRLKPDTYPYLLASNTRGEVNTRYSILLAYPQQTLSSNDMSEDLLDQIPVSLQCDHDVIDLPFIGGWFIYLGYEYASFIESAVGFHTQSSELPLALISRIPSAVIIDHSINSCTLVSEEARPDLIEAMLDDISQAGKFTPSPLPDVSIFEEEADIYRSYLKHTHQYIIDGDIFQANLSRLWQASFSHETDPVSLYHKLSQTNPAPFAAMIKLGNHYVLSSSPERLVSVDQGIIETRPIAGTHPRGKTLTEDKELSNILIKHPKERAEHVMLIDLERNDLGRVCQPGSIRVDDQMIVESYQHVHHIVSNIRGKLKPELSVKNVVHAVFPGGTITGCPKVRCMQIISELEQTARGAYTGSLGYISDHGRMDLNILIRTMVLNNRDLSFRAGAGIVHDSITEKELSETRHKARGMLNALQADQ
jgi:anthranilate synthase component I